jgi:transglutaminase-like putative cysteine protease
MGRSQTGAVVSVERFFEFSLLGLVTSGYLAVLSSGYLDWPTAALTSAGLCLRAGLVLGLIRLPLSPGVVTVLTAAYMGFYPLDYLLLSRELLPATVHLVFFLAIIKVLTACSSRDHIFVGVIAFLALLAASVLSTNLNFFAALACFLLCGVASFASAEIRRSARKPCAMARGGLSNFHWRLAALSLTVALGILLLTGGMFFLLPRTAQAAFQHLVPQRYHVPGFSNEMTLGQIGEIRQHSRAVMRARFEGSGSPGDLKWRGVALAHFDGQRWSNPPEAGELLRAREGLLQLAEDVQRRRTGRRINYEVQLGAIASDALFLVGTPEFLRINLPAVIRTSTGSYRLPFGASEELRYGAYSFLEGEGLRTDKSAGQKPPGTGPDYLQLPALDPRIPALARQIAAGQVSAEGRVQAVEQYLRSHYAYTTKLLSRQGADPLASFLFERRQGHCEYFASAMVVMLRALGIPSRVATGFQTGVFNPISGWYVVRASDAHSWVEAWIPRRGWTTFEPTPQQTRPSRPSLWARLGFYLDAAETFWDEWVLNYDLDRQLTLASSMESSGRRLSTHWLDHVRTTLREWKSAATAWFRAHGVAAGLLLLAALALGLAGPRAWVWWKARRRVRQVRRGAGQPSDATLLYARLLGLLKRRGFEKPAWLTPAEFARQLPASALAVRVEEFTLAYNHLRFGGCRQAALRMVALLGEMEGIEPSARRQGRIPTT